MIGDGPVILSRSRALATDHFDVLIVGAGLSGIGAAVHLQKECPGKSYAILEGRGASGGTWDLFRYPGIRSDSDMYTLGYGFKPWTNAKAIADGPSILQYVRETSAENGVEPHIRYNHWVKRASWSTADARWTVEAEKPNGEIARFTCGFLTMCSGYYRYSAGYTPEWAGMDRFRGKLVHPQHWPEDLDYRGKKIVVIGSGATAVTLVPELAKDAAHVTMLQRSPTYMASRPAEDAIANWLRARLPAKVAYGITRWKNVLMQMFFYNMARKRPDKVKDRLIEMVKEQLPEGYDVGRHFTPRYNPWDQRLCLVPDNDFFLSIKAGKSSVVTDTIECFTEDGIRLASGETLQADIIVTATGLVLELLGGMGVRVDGREVNFADTVNYKGMMFSDVPNLASTFGYTNASWTLKADLTASYVCRLLNHMDAVGMRQATPRLRGVKGVDPWLDFSSGYVQRAIAKFPKQAADAPWRLHQNYARDLMDLKLGAVDDDAMEFSNPAPADAPAHEAKAVEAMAE
jgi:cation diffusion facilitator CzcD-associated flavoprotein CzcO